MPKPRKPVELQASHLGKNEIEQRKMEQELSEITVDNIMNPPSYLEPDAQAEWKRVVPLMLQINQIDDLDFAALSNYCYWWAEFIKGCKIRSTIDPETDFEAYGKMITKMSYVSDQLRKNSSAAGLSKDMRLKAAAVKIKQQNEQIDDEFGGI